MITRSGSTPSLVRADTRTRKPGFWLRYDLARHIKRWAPIVGEENITFVILDPADRGMLLGAFEGLLGLPSGLLVPDSSLTNPSLPHPEIEMLAAFNRAFRASGRSRTEFVQAIRGKAVVDFKADPEALKLGRIMTPRWAAERANQAAQPWIEAVEASQAQVIGNLDHLLVDPAELPNRCRVTHHALDRACRRTGVRALSGRADLWRAAGPRTPRGRTPRASGRGEAIGSDWSWTAVEDLPPVKIEADTT